MSQRTTYPDTALLKALDIDESDLAANRQGYLSQRQHERQTQHKAQFNRNRRYGIIGFAVILLIAYAQISSLSPAEREAAARPLIVLIGICGIGAAVFLLLRWLDPQTETAPERVEQTSGVIKKRSIELGREHVDKIVVNNRVFNVPLNVFAEFKDKHPYHIYFLKSTQQLLSAEPLAPIPDENEPI